MSDTDPRQRCPGPLHTAGGGTQPAWAASGLVTTGGYRLADSDLLALLTRGIDRSPADDGFTGHHHERIHPLAATEPRADRRGIGLSSTARAVLRRWSRSSTRSAICQFPDTALGAALSDFGAEVLQLCSGDARLATGRRAQQPGAGR
jgi:hypothetical protein